VQKSCYSSKHFLIANVPCELRNTPGEGIFGAVKANNLYEKDIDDLVKHADIPGAKLTKN